MAHATFLAAAERSIDLAAAVSTYREHAAQLRRLTQVRPTRNSGATRRAIARRTAERDAVELALVLADRSALLGELVEENKLLIRLATAKNLGQDRPELKVRLTSARRRIRVLAGI